MSDLDRQTWEAMRPPRVEDQERPPPLDWRSLSPSDFSIFLRELEQSGVSSDQLSELRTQYQSNPQFKEDPEGVKRASVLPMKWGSPTEEDPRLGWERIKSGDFEWAVPEFLREGAESLARGATAPGKIAQGVPYSQDEMLGAAWDTAGMALTGSVGAPVPSGALRTFGGKNIKVERFPQREDTTQPLFLRESERVDPDKDSGFPTENPKEVVAQYRSPIPGVISRLKVPEKGILGRDLLTELEKNPSVRPQELRYYASQVDPQHRYTREELSNAISTNPPRVLRGNPEFQTYQRQQVTDREVDYAELTVDETSPEFRPNRDHFHRYGEGVSNLAWSRVSIRERPDGSRYVFVEEMQGDLVQGGWDPPRPAKLPGQEALKVLRDPQPVPVNVLEPTTFPTTFGEAWGGFALFFKENSTPEGFQRLIEDVERYTSDSRLRGEATWRKIFQERDFDEILERYEIDDSNFDFDRNDFRDFIEGIAEDITSFTPEVKAPPITTFKDSTRLSLEAALAYAQKNDINEIIIPSFERILTAPGRLRPDMLEKARQPGSSFYKTYIQGVNEFLQGMQKEFGDKFVVREVELPYKNDDWKGWQTRARDLWLGEYGQPQWSTTTIGNFVELSKEVTEAGFPIPDHHKTFLNMLSRATGIEENSLKEAILSSNTGVDFERFITETLKARSTNEKGTSLSIELLKDYDLTTPKFAKGGLMQQPGLNIGMAQTDPVSGNEVPLGSTPEEVRDDIPAKLSEGEYVVPADVVRYFGTRFFEGLVQEAKAGVQEMEANGRIGGELEEDDDELPFDISELEMEDDTPAFAEGGEVKRDLTSPGFNPNQYGFGGETFGGLGGNTSPEVRTYINSKGERRAILFIGGKPVSRIPEGFVPDTEEGRKQLNKSPTSTNPFPTSLDRGPGDGEYGRAGGLGESDTSSGRGDTYSSNAVNPEDPMQGAKEALEGKGSFVGRAVGAVAGMVAGPVGSLLGQAVTSAAGVSGAIANRDYARQIGNIELANEIDKMISESRAGRMFSGMFGGRELELAQGQPGFEQAMTANAPAGMSFNRDIGGYTRDGSAAPTTSPNPPSRPTSWGGTGNPAPGPATPAPSPPTPSAGGGGSGGNTGVDVPGGFGYGNDFRNKGGFVTKKRKPIPPTPKKSLKVLDKTPTKS